jgi:hypothetical protein
MVSVLLLLLSIWSTNLYPAIEGFTESLSKELPLQWNINASPTPHFTPHSPLIIHPQLDLHPSARGI